MAIGTLAEIFSHGKYPSKFLRQRLAIVFRSGFLNGLAIVLTRVTRGIYTMRIAS